MDSNWVTILIAMFVAYIAWQQHELAKDRLKLDLFDKRFTVYLAVKSALSELGGMRQSDTSFFYRFRSETQDGLFLFDDRIENFITKIGSLILDYDTALAELEGNLSAEDRKKFEAQKRELRRQAHEESKGLKDVFSPYLKFDRWSKP